jgi:hypothetical protein
MNWEKTIYAYDVRYVIMSTCLDKKRDTMASLNSKVDNSNEDQIRRDEDFSLLSRVQFPNFQFSAYMIYSDCAYFELFAWLSDCTI